MDREETEQYIYRSYLRAEKNQDYNASDSEKRKPELTRKWIEQLCADSTAKSAVITGSKGKGSISIMIASIMEKSCRTGLMTSPHIQKFNERIRVDGHCISDEELVRIIEMCRPRFDKIDSRCASDVCISPVGIQTIAALTYFNENKTLFNVFECGKGAQYDDVNNVIHEFAVINSIFLEHTRELGSSLGEIAQNKAYVITGGQKFAYSAHQNPEIMDIIRHRALLMDVPLKEYGRNFRAENVDFTNSGMTMDIITDNAEYKDIVIPLFGRHQTENCALAVALCEDVLGRELDNELLRQSLCKIIWPGRMQVISAKNPFILLDACINRESCLDVKDILNRIGITRITLIVGIPDDKDYEGVIDEMSDIADRIILTGSHSPHYRFSRKRLEKPADEDYMDYAEDAIEEALKHGNPLVILGTTSVISEAETYFTHPQLHPCHVHPDCMP